MDCEGREQQRGSSGVGTRITFLPSRKETQFFRLIAGVISFTWQAGKQRVVSGTDPWKDLFETAETNQAYHLHIY